MSGARERERIDTIVIGAGQAGLSVGYELRRLGIPFLILDANERVGDSWRNRWDSLRLFTPARFDGLTGMRFPAHGNAFPTKDEMADYLGAYATRFEFPVRLATRVDRLSQQGNRFVIRSGERQFESEQVVVAMSDYQRSRVPVFARDLDPAILQLHSSEYRSPSQLRDGGVLVVGAGNSGAEIAKEVAQSHKTWLSGRDVGHIPFRIGGLASRLILARLVLRVIFHRVLTVRTPIGRRVRPKVLFRGGPLIRLRPSDLTAVGVERVARVAGAHSGRPVLDDGRMLDAANVIWCTGFTSGFSWIELPVLAANGLPEHESGVSTRVPGLYFVGQHFLHAMSSVMVHGVGRDAARIAAMIATRTAARGAGETRDDHLAARVS